MANKHEISFTGYKHVSGYVSTKQTLQDARAHNADMFDKSYTSYSINIAFNSGALIDNPKTKSCL